MLSMNFAVTEAHVTRPEGAHATGYTNATDLWLQVAHAFEGPSSARRKRYAPLATTVRDGDFVVDLGCGDGTFLDLVRERGGRGLGVDLDEAQVAVCASRGHEAVCARIQDLDWSQRRPDMVSLIHIIEHISPVDALDLLRDVREVLSQRGRLLIVTPNIGHPVVQENFWLDVTHVRPYPQMLLNTFAATLGFPYFQSGTMADGLETWSYAYSDPGDALRLDNGLDFELVLIRLVELGHGDDVEVITGAVEELSARDSAGFELDDLLIALRAAGDESVGEHLASAADDVLRRTRQTNPLTTPLAERRDSRGMWIHPRYGYRFTYRPEDRFVGPGLIHAAYEPYESELFNSLLRPDSVFLDVGANIGHFSLLAAGRIDPELGEVVALEPSGDNYETLTTNLAANDARSVSALRLAASDDPGTLTLHLNRGNTGDHRIGRGGPAPSDEFEGAEQVSVRDLDSLCKELGIVPTLIKVDTQGHELAVFRGMAEILASTRPLHVIFEFAPYLMAAAGDDSEELLRIALQSFDELYIVDEAEARLTPATRERIAERCVGESYTNLLGVRRAAAARPDRGMHG